MADSRGTMPDLHVADRLLAALDAIQPVLVMIVAHIKLHRFVVQRLIENFFGLGFKFASADEDAPLFALERCSALEFSSAAAAFHDRAVGIFESDVKFFRSFVEFLLVINCRALGFDRTGIIGAESPLSDVHVMGPPIGHLASGVVPEKAEEIMHAVLVVGPLRRGPKPHIVIQFRRGLAIRHTARSLLDPIRPRQTDFDSLDFAKAARPDVLARFPKVLVRTLLTSGLEDALVMTHGLSQRLANSGVDKYGAQVQAYARIYQSLQAHAASLAYIDTFMVLAVGGAIMFWLAFLLKKNDPGGGGVRIAE